jgi:two-component system, OmpR family, phosphate regulon sensor histidine kinase PhoR
MLITGLTAGFQGPLEVIISPMRYQSQKTKVIIAMISISLAGLMGVQLALLDMAWELKDQAFERNVINALTISAQKLEVGEITSNALDVIYKFDLSDTLATSSHQMRFIASDVLQHPVELPATLPDSSFRTRQVTVVMSDDRTELIQRIVDDLVIKPLLPLNERLKEARLDSLLRQNLDAVGIGLVPQFYVYTAANDSLVLVSANGEPDIDGAKLRESKFRSRLFPLDPNSDAFEIVLLFPGQRTFLLKQVWPLLGASIIFMVIIIVAFGLMISASRQQHRFAGGIVDFINNMTHEFKTPISTVALASEAIARDDIIEQPEALRRYNGMIRDENHRMRQQVERILQIAQLETGDYQLNLAPVDMHELVRNCAENFALQIEKRRGSLNLDLGATQTLVQGDPVHLTNVLANLVDNAIKYSPESPIINLESSNRDGRIQLTVSDQGIGIERADRHRVFEKYYRCPTGDRHDVKGFGLGLCYVQLLVDAHGGHVNLDGTPGQGTRVLLDLPLEQSGQLLEGTP